MAIKQVMAYFMHETEKVAANADMPGAAVTDSYLLGAIDDTKIAALRAKGLIVHELGDVKPGLSALSPALESLQQEAVVAHDARMSALAAAARQAPALESLTRGASTPAAAPAGPTTHALQVIGPLLTPWRQALEGVGVTFIERIGSRRYAIDLDPSEAATVRKLPFVSSVESLADYDVAPPVPVAVEAAPVVERPGEVLTYDIRLKAPEGRDAVLAFLK